MVHSNSPFEIILFCEKLNIPWDKWEHQNSWNLLESNPITMFGDGMKHICRLCWRFIIDINNHQQVPPSLTFVSPWAKLNSAIDQKLLQCFHASKVLLWIRMNWSDFQTYPYYLQSWGFSAFTWVLSNWKTERSSQSLCFKFFVPPLCRSFYKFLK